MDLSPPRIHALRFVLGFCLLQPVIVHAQSQTLEANRALVSTGKPAAPPSGHSRKASLSATVIDGDAAPVVTLSGNGIFSRVGLKHDHIVDIAVQYPAASAGHVISVQALDGGKVIAGGGKLAVAADGSLRFKFHAGHAPGAYHISLRDGTDEVGLEFWVMDEEHPQNNPATVNSTK